MYGTETHDQFIGLRARGGSLRKIADQLGISFSTAWDWDQEHRAEIKDLRACLIDSFKQTFLPDIGEVLDSLTAELKRVNAELAKRDYSKEPTWLLANRQSTLLSRLDKLCANPLSSSYLILIVILVLLSMVIPLPRLLILILLLLPLPLLPNRHNRTQNQHKTISFPIQNPPGGPLPLPLILILVLLLLLLLLLLVSLLLPLPLLPLQFSNASG